MAVGMWRGVANAARKQKKRNRGVGNVARTVKKRWRGVDNVARLTFQDGLTLYDNGTVNHGLTSTGNGTVTFGTDAITFSGTKDYVLTADAIDYTKYSTLNIAMMVTSGSSSAKYLEIMHGYGSYAVGHFESLSYDVEKTFVLDLDSPRENGGTEFRLGFIGYSADDPDSTSYAIGGEIYKIWLE